MCLQARLALCCKAMLPILCAGHVSVRLDKPDEPSTQLTRCLERQPDGVSHLELWGTGNHPGINQLIDLRCARTGRLACMVLGFACARLCHVDAHVHKIQGGLCVNVAVCWRSLLSNLRKLSLINVSFPLPALQPVATRLQSLDIFASRLGGSADGFLSMVWTALTALCLDGSRVTDGVLSAVNLPVLKDLRLAGFQHQGGVLQPVQLCCPQLCSLAFELDRMPQKPSTGSRQCCSLLNLARLTTLFITRYSHQAIMGLGLPSSLTRLTVQDWSEVADIEWVLLQAAKCIRGGPQLRSLIFDNISSSPQDVSPHPEVVPWGASSNAHCRQLGQQLSGLEDLYVGYGNGPTVLSALGAVACTAPSLTRLQFSTHGPNGMALPPICSASLKSIRLYMQTSLKVPPLPITLTFLPGCIQLRDVYVQFLNTPKEGAYVKVCCHCISERCIMPFLGRAELTNEAHMNTCADLQNARQFLPTAAAPQCVQPYTVLFTCQSGGPEEASQWGHVVMASVL